MKDSEIKIYPDSEIEDVVKLVFNNNIPPQFIEVDGYYYHVRFIHILTQNYIEVCLHLRDDKNCWAMFVKNLAEARSRLREDLKRKPELTKTLLRIKINSQELPKKNRPDYLKIVK